MQEVQRSVLCVQMKGAKAKKLSEYPQIPEKSTSTVARYLYVVASQLCKRARFPRAQQGQVSARTRGHLTCGKLQKQIHVSAQIRPSVWSPESSCSAEAYASARRCRLFPHGNMHGVTEIHQNTGLGGQEVCFPVSNSAIRSVSRVFRVSFNAAVVRRQVLRWTEDSSKNHSRI